MTMKVTELESTDTHESYVYKGYRVIVRSGADRASFVINQVGAPGFHVKQGMARTFADAKRLARNVVKDLVAK